MKIEDSLLAFYQKIEQTTFAEENSLVEKDINFLAECGYAPANIAKIAYGLIEKMRNNKDDSLFDSFMKEYGLDTEEGLAMMRLSEALLRIPDNETANQLVHDVVSGAKWMKHVNSKNNALVNFSSAGMSVAKRLFAMGDLASAPTNPVVRRLLKLGVYQIGGHFICGKNIDRAIHGSKELAKKGFLFSYDMLGEGARNEAQSNKYLDSYIGAVSALGLINQSDLPIEKRTGISVKLSALYSRYLYSKKEQVMTKLLPRLKSIIVAAKDAGVPVTIDAEEAHRLEISLEIFAKICRDDEFIGFNGIGLAVQAYQKRSQYVLDFIAELAKETNRIIPVRLVKGAYWDSEIKSAQEEGLPDYPVFTRKCHTDISYLSCAYKMLEYEMIYPQFATHNAYSVAAILDKANGKNFEFQMLYGMGNGLYDYLVEDYNCRIYAPVGDYEELLAYLIRRLLENGANTSFVKNIMDENISLEELCEDPIARSLKKADSKLPKPSELYFPKRSNSSGLNVNYVDDYNHVHKYLNEHNNTMWKANSIIGGKDSFEGKKIVFNPAINTDKIGESSSCGVDDVIEAVDISYESFEREWEHSDVKVRAGYLEKYAEILELNKDELISLLVKEAGKNIEDSISEVREAIDFCYYYASQARESLGKKSKLDSPTGEENIISLHGRGVFVCISPWNFPLAIFIGQITAALVAGNTVIAKPAAQTTLIAKKAVELLYQAGIPKNVLQLVIGSGKIVGNALVGSNKIAGICFTGSTETAQHIYQERAKIGGKIIPIIAETGGLNAMIVDSSVLIEQTVDDVIISAFGSVGQRCSALRVVYVDEVIIENFIDVLAGAMQDLIVDIPELIETDIGPVIDGNAKSALEEHIADMKSNHQLVAVTPLSEEVAEKGYFVAPHCFRINNISDIGGEKFGPILHVIGYKASNIEKIVSEINNAGFGLTCGIQTRIMSKANKLAEKIRVGNVYINRSMIGATVGVQPFGGENLSGTGPKAGGPNYLHAFTTERTKTINTTAIGGNRDLLIK